MRSVTSSVYSVARARTGTSTSATSQTTEATLDTTRVRQSTTRTHGLSSAAESTGTLRLGDQPAAEREVRKPGALERVDGVLRRARERFAVEVERGVEHGADAGATLELTDHPIVAGVPRFVEDLGARGPVVRVHGSGDLVPPLRIRRERQHHIRRAE